jgi:hypothetical protein
MQRRNLLMMAILIVATPPQIACEQSLGATPDAVQATASATIEPIEGSDLHRVTLTARAAERIAVKTVRVREIQVDRTKTAAPRKVVPYAAVLYGLDNQAWVYTTSAPLVYVRHRIVVDYIDGDDAFLSEGPAVDTAVVTAGAAELFGTEFGTRR